MPLGSPYRASIKRNCLFQELSIHICQNPQYRSPLSRFASWSHYKEKDTLFPKPSLTCLEESPVKETSLQVPVMEPLYRDSWSVSKAFFYISVRVPSEGDLPLCFPSWPPIERETSFPESFCTCLSKSLERSPCFRFPIGAPIERDAHFQSLLFYMSIRVIVKELSTLKIVSHKQYSHCLWSRTWMEGLRTIGCSMVPQGDHLDTAVDFGTVPFTLAWVHQSHISPFMSE